MKFISMCSGCGGMDLGLEKGGIKCVGQVEIMPYALRVLNKRWPDVPKHTDILTLLRSDSLVRTYQTPIQKAKVLKAKEVLFSLSVCALSTSLIRLGYSLKTSPDCFPSMGDETWPKSFKRWPKAATGGLTDYWTVNTSESPNDAEESLLLDVLEDHVHPKYFLSKKAVIGMIRRSKKSGKGGYVFLLNAEMGKTRQLTRLSLRELEKMLQSRSALTLPILRGQQEQEEETSSLKQSEAKITEIRREAGGTTETSSRKLSARGRGETLCLYGRTHILRKLTPTEKEKLQGFPRGWTLVEE